MEPHNIIIIAQLGCLSLKYNILNSEKPLMAFLPLHFPRSVMHNVQTNLQGDLSAFDAYKQNTGCAIALEAVVCRCMESE